MKTDKVIYWVSTSLLIIVVGVFSIADVLQLEAVKEATRHLGFPYYILPLFGCLKIAGTVCAVVPRFKRFREAAYAGIFFFFAGAFYCHIANGDAVKNTVVPFVVLAIAITSYVFQGSRIGLFNCD